MGKWPQDSNSTGRHSVGCEWRRGREGESSMCLGDIRNRTGVLSPGLLQALPTLAQVPTECQTASPATCQLISSKCCWFLSPFTCVTEPGWVGNNIL